MALTYAPCCSIHRQHCTTAPSGICPVCRSCLAYAPDLVTAGGKQSRRLEILRLHSQGRAFEQIAKPLGTRKFSIYGIYSGMMHLPSYISRTDVTCWEKTMEESQ